MSSSPPSNALLAVRDLRTYYRADGGFVRAVDGVSFEVQPGQSVGIAGESGSGKTQTALSILGLLDGVPGLVGGEVWWEDQNLLADLPAYCTRQETPDGLIVRKDVGGWRARLQRRLDPIRGEQIAMVFQEPKTSLFPYLTVADHLRETIAARSGKAAARTYEPQALDLLQQLRFDDPQRTLQSYPHQLSGGESQRVMLGLALLGDPRLLIADEPTTLLDTITQRRILDLLGTLVTDRNLALLLITHNLALLRLLVQHIVILYAGQIVEQGPTDRVIRPASNDGHPYTHDLIQASRTTRTGPLVTVPKNSCGCRYYHRCLLKDTLPDRIRKRCLYEKPPVVHLDENHTVACWARESEA
ncbi:MAG TPA: ABC transporter ATP-binding protein [Rhodothermales bacterium]|nr:ABC transporter ATP-binding protein [Rhodothermales bacterium]